MKPKEIQNIIWKKFLHDFGRLYGRWHVCFDHTDYIITLIKIMYKLRHDSYFCKQVDILCTFTLNQLLSNHYPVNQLTLDYASVSNWKGAVILLKKKLPNHSPPPQNLGIENFLKDLQAASPDKQKLHKLITNYKYLYSIYLKIKYAGIVINDRESPFYQAITHGLSDDILEVFIECDWYLNENGKIYYTHSSVSTLIEEKRFKIARLFIIQLLHIKSSKSQTLSSLTTQSKISFDDLLPRLSPLPYYLPSFDTFDKQLEFARYMYYVTQTFDLQISPEHYSNKVLLWYKKYQASILTVIIGKADHLPRLNKDVILTIVEFSS